MNNTKPKPVNWKAVQELYDTGASMIEVAEQFGIHTRRIVLANKAGLIKTRTPSEAAQLRVKNKPREQTDDTKSLISERMKQRHAEGKAHTLGHNRHKQEPSWPERWWLKVLTNEVQDQAFETEYKFHRYSIDFAWPAKKIALEIDGEQHHRFESQIASDRRKDALLREAGWTVCRIPWKECYNNPNKFIEQVKVLVDTMVIVV
jgi:very-short-patch-repair endonuclease